MKIIKCESGKLVNADHIVSIEKIYQQGLKKYAVVARTVLDDLVTLYQFDSGEEAEQALEKIQLYLNDDYLNELTNKYRLL